MITTQDMRVSVVPESQGAKSLQVEGGGVGRGDVHRGDE